MKSRAKVKLRARMITCYAVLLGHRLLRFALGVICIFCLSFPETTRAPTAYVESQEEVWGDALICLGP